MPNWQLAQLNIAQPLASLDSPVLSEFVENLDRINAMAEAAPGFIWRLVDMSDDDFVIFGDDFIVNLSVWDSIESLHQFVYKSGHVEIMRRKKEWFERMPRAHMVLWWIPAGQFPTVDGANEKLLHLQKEGPTQKAFTFRQAFVNPGELVKLSN